MAAGNHENTAEYLENITFNVLTNKRKYIKIGLRTLMQHYKGEIALHPKQIQFIIKSILESVLYFEEKSMDVYNDLPEDIKQKINKYYEGHLAFSVKTNEGQTRKTPPDIIESFNRRQEENNIRVHQEAKEYIENN